MANDNRAEFISRAEEKWMNLSTIAMTNMKYKGGYFMQWNFELSDSTTQTPDKDSQTSRKNRTGYFQLEWKPSAETVDIGVASRNTGYGFFCSKALVAFIVIFLSLAISGPSIAGPVEDCKEHAKFGVPSNDPALLCRQAYLLSHSSDYKEPIWVAYHLTSGHLKGSAKRSNKFIADPDLPEGDRAMTKDYTRSGYDRGHMMPAADAKWKGTAMKQTFYLSNIAPQVGVGFNRGIWVELESKVRKWANKRKELYVYVGPLFLTDKIRTIGPNKVGVPTHFFKVVFDPQKGEAIGFVMPNTKLQRGTIPQYIRSIRSIEELTGFDFLSELDKETQDQIETEAPDMWQ